MKRNESDLATVLLIDSKLIPTEARYAMHVMTTPVHECKSLSVRYTSPNSIQEANQCEALQ